MIDEIDDETDDELPIDLKELCSALKYVTDEAIIEVDGLEMEVMRIQNDPPSWYVQWFYPGARIQTWIAEIEYKDGLEIFKLMTSSYADGEIVERGKG